MNHSSYVIEGAAEGKSLVVTGQWSETVERALAYGEADALILNYARGFCEGNLDFLNGEWPLRRLTVIDRSIVNLDPIGRLQGLEELSIQAAPGSELDLGSLPHLRSVNAEWSLIARSLGAVNELRSVSTWMFGEADLRVFRNHWALRRLTIKDAPYLESLAGLDDSAFLTALTIVAAPCLHDIDEIRGLSTSLRELKFEECGRIDSVEVVDSLVGLRILGISESGGYRLAVPGPIAVLARDFLRVGIDANPRR